VKRRIEALDATRLRIEGDPHGVLAALIEALLRDRDERYLRHLLLGAQSEIHVSPDLIAERIRAEVLMWRLVKAGATANVTAADLEVLLDEAIATRHAWALENFPLGCTVGEYTLVECLHGTADRGLYRGRDGRLEPVLVTLGPPQIDRAAVEAELTLEAPSIMTLRYIGPLQHADPTPYDGMVEMEPSGSPTMGRIPPLRAVRRALAIASAVAEVHARGQRLGFLRNELIYFAEDDTLRGIAPRCERFLSTAQSRTRGVPPCFENFYMAPEVLASPRALPGEAADVFSICALLGYWAAGEHPFEGSGSEQAIAIATGRRRPWTGNRLIGSLVTKGLHATPEARPSMRALVGLLEDMLELIAES
jgi:hypothetical protein